MAILGFGVGAALALTGALGADDESTRQPPRGTTTTTTAGTASAPSWCRTPLTGADPLRLWIGGDSLAGSLGPSLGAMTGATGIVQPIYDSRISTGLASPSFFDWPKHATSEMARLDPEVVVFMIGTNDYAAVMSDQSKRSYQQLVEQMIGVLSGGKRHVYWVGAPTLDDKRTNEGVRLVNAAAREVVERHPEVTFVDAYMLFADSNGRYTQTRPGPSGSPVRVRTGDGIHFTPEGGDLLGSAVFARLESECRLAAQSVRGAPKPVIKTQGATDIPGTNRGPGSTTTSASSSPTTTPAPTTTSSTTSTTSSTTTSSTPAAPPVE